MIIAPVTWIGIGLAVALIGALWAGAVDRSVIARQRALVSSSLAFLCTLAAWIEAIWRVSKAEEGGGAWPGVLTVDPVNGPLLPLVELLCLATIAATLRSKMRRFSFARILLLEALLLATLAAKTPWALIALLGLSSLPPAFEMRVRGRSLRVYLLHMGMSMACLVSGWWLVSRGESQSSESALWGFALVAAGVAIRAGLVPAHCWVIDLFGKASFGTALVVVAPIPGAYAAVRLLAAGAPDGVMHALTLGALGTAVLSAAMSLTQTDARRLFARIFLTHASLVLAGIALSTRLGMTAGFCLWLSAPLALVGVGLTLRSLEARTGRLSLRSFLGLHVQVPTFAALFLFTGLSAVGFPGTLGFFGVEMLTDAAARVSKPLALLVIVSTAIGGIALLRAYAVLFLGASHRATVDLRIRRVELAALLALVVLLLGGTLWPQLGIERRSRAAGAILDLRERHAQAASGRPRSDSRDEGAREQAAGRPSP